MVMNFVEGLRFDGADSFLHLLTSLADSVYL